MVDLFRMFNSFTYNTHMLVKFRTFLGNFIPHGYCSIPLLIEFIMVMIFIIYLPFRQAYRFKEKDFFFAEGVYLALGFIYVSVASGAGSFSYVLFGPNIIVKDIYACPLIEDPYVTYEAFNYISDIPVQGLYLAVYSFFGIIIIGLGFAMTFHSSIGLSIPFIFIAIGVCCRTVPLGVIMIVQCFIHLIYIGCLYFEKGRYFLSGFGERGLKTMGNQFVSIIMIGATISLLLYAFPILTFCVKSEIFNTDWSWAAFFTVSVIGALAILLDYFFIEFSHCVLYSVLIPSLMAILTIAGGSMWCGNSMFVRAFTYQLTHLCWTIALCFLAYTSGFSPVVFKFYSSLISVAAIFIVDYFDGFGWIELVFAIVQFIVDAVGIEFFRKKKAKLISWVFLSIVGFLLLTVVGTLILFFVISIITFILDHCKILDKLDEDTRRAKDIAYKRGLKKGDGFIYNGKRYIL